MISREVILDMNSPKSDNDNEEEEDPAREDLMQ